MKSEKTCSVGGRPRGFCIDSALDRALRVFWEKGYDGTSISDLTEAMGINRPSLYAAYGNKEELFMKAIDRYTEIYGAFVCEALQKPTAREVVEALLGSAACEMANPDRPKGCLGIQGALSCSSEAQVVKNELIKRRGLLQEALADRFRRAIDQGDLPPGSDAVALAAYVATVMNGLSVQATNGASRDELKQIVDVAIQSFAVAST